jgi:ataxia telangiectasia mutated family protein
VNISYVRFAVDRPDSKFKSGAKVPLKTLATGQRLGQDVITYKLPPPTMKIELRVDCDYSDIPTVAKFSPEFTIASGVSAPKIVTAVASNGERYKQLVCVPPLSAFSPLSRCLFSALLSLIGINLIKSTVQGRK